MIVNEMTIDDLRKYPVERIGLGFCRMNCFEWDEELFGPSPEGWDKLNDTERHNHPEFRRYRKVIDDILPTKMQNMYWWTIKLKKTYEEWEKWWNNPRSIYFKKGDKAE